MEPYFGFTFNPVHFSINYVCIVYKALETANDREIKEFRGVHRKGKSHIDVNYVYFQNKSVNYFPRHLQEHFPNLTELIILSCDIKEITKQDLIGLKGLFGLHVLECKLTSLSDDLFTDMPNLNEVSFRDNKIVFGFSRFLNPLRGRQNVKVDLRRNINIDACFWRGVENSLESLEELMKMINNAIPTDPECNPMVNEMWNSGRFSGRQIPPQLQHQDVSGNSFGACSKVEGNRTILFGQRKLFKEKCVKPAINNSMIFNPLIKEMWFSGKFSNLTIIADEKEFKVHKNILGARSEVLAQIFEDQNEATEIKIPDFTSKSVEALLKFIYTNEASDDENKMENFEIAQKFKVVTMKSFYEKTICEELDAVNALEIFLFAHRFSSEILKKEAFQIIIDTIPDEVPEKLVEDPEKLKKLIEARRVYEEILEEK